MTPTDKSTALVAFVEAVDEARGLREKARMAATEGSKALVAYAKAVDKSHGFDVLTKLKSRTEALHAVSHRLRKRIRNKARAELADLVAPAQITNTYQMPEGAVIPVGHLDCAIAKVDCLAAGAVHALMVDIPRGFYLLDPRAVRILVADAVTPDVNRRIDIEKVEINFIPQLDTLIPSDAWEAPAGCGVPVRWGIFSQPNLLECMYIHVRNTSPAAVRVIINIYGEGLREIPPGVGLGQRPLIDPWERRNS